MLKVFLKINYATKIFFKRKYLDQFIYNLNTFAVFLHEIHNIDRKSHCFKEEQEISKPRPKIPGRLRIDA